MVLIWKRPTLHLCYIFKFLFASLIVDCTYLCCVYLQPHRQQQHILQISLPFWNRFSLLWNKARDIDLCEWRVHICLYADLILINFGTSHLYYLLIVGGGISAPLHFKKEPKTPVRIDMNSTEKHDIQNIWEIFDHNSY